MQDKTNLKILYRILNVLISFSDLRAPVYFTTIIVIAPVCYLLINTFQPCIKNLYVGKLSVAKFAGEKYYVLHTKNG